MGHSRVNFSMISCFLICPSMKAKLVFSQFGYKEQSFGYFEDIPTLKILKSFTHYKNHIPCL